MAYHSAIKTTQFQAMYDYPPPTISEVPLPRPEGVEARDFILDKQQMLGKLKENLARAQGRMKKYADRKRSERQFAEGDMVYLKMQP